MDYKHIESHSDSNFTFPFAINYDPSSDTHTTILDVLVDKCGLAGGQPQDLTVDYTINLIAKVLFVKVNPTIDSSTSFKCPLTQVKHTQNYHLVFRKLYSNGCGLLNDIYCIFRVKEYQDLQMGHHWMNFLVDKKLSF